MYYQTSRRCVPTDEGKNTKVVKYLRQGKNTAQIILDEVEIIGLYFSK
jgi:hypothetical protein